MKFIYTLFIFFFISSQLLAQGWQYTFGGNKEEFCEAVVQMEDDGYILVGHGQSFGEDGDRDVYAVRLDLNGNLQWSNFYDEGFTEYAYDAIQTPKGETLIAGEIQATQTSNTDAYLIKINAFGDFKWSKTYGGEMDEHIYSISASNDGGYVMAGYIEQDNGDRNMLIIKIDASGEEIWRKDYGSAINEEANAVVATGDGYVMVGYAANTSLDYEMYVVKVNEAGGLIWSRTYGTRFYELARDVAVTPEGDLLIGGNKGTSDQFYLVKTDRNGIVIWEKFYDSGFLEDIFEAMTLNTDGSILLTGTVSVDEANSDIYLLKVSANGEEIWSKQLGDEGRADLNLGAIKTSDQGYVIVGQTTSFRADPSAESPLNDFIAIKADENGNINSNRIQGRVYFDRDASGTFTIGDVPLKNWPIRLVNNRGGEEDKIFYTASNDNGNYGITVGTGRYVASVLNQNENYWTLTRNNIPNVFITTYDTLSMVDFPVTADILCAYVEVGVSAPSLSICNDVNYTVSYCNIGSAQSGEFFVDVEFDEALTVNDAELPFTQQDNGAYRFDLSSLEIGQCGDFVVNASMACEGYVTGQSHKVKVSVDSTLACLEPDPDWDMSSLAVEGDCDTENEEAEFRVTNIGDGNMGSPTRIHVIQEDLVVFSAPVQLDATKETIIERKAEGKTTRIIVEQSEGHPGRSFPTLAIEGCGEDGNGATITTGYVTLFPEDDADPFVAIDVQENLADASGNMLRAFPKGYREKNYIETGRDITYHIQFQNLENESLRHVVIRDTLPEGLDIASIRPEASSHPYKFDIYENRILRFTFDKLDIPSINESEADSKGFIQFRVRQMPGLAKGTVIENKALISLNFSKPTLTNPVKHTIGGDLLEFVEIGEFVSNKDTKLEGITVKVGPNPFTETTLFTIEGWNNKTANLQIFDVNGRMLQIQRFEQDKLLFNKRDLSTGVYFYRVESDGKLLDSGKLLVQ